MKSYTENGGEPMEDKRQKWICIAIGLFLCFPSLNSAIGSIIKLFFGSQFKLGTYVVYVIYALVMLYALFRNSHKISLSTLVITVFMIVSFILSVALNQISSYVWTSFGDIVGNPMYLFLFYGFLGLYLAQYLKNMDLLCSYLDRFALATIVLALVQYIVALQRDTSPQYMVFSYNLLFPTAYLSLRCISDFRFKRLIGMVIGAGLIFIAGCRGALICYLGAILLYILFAGRISRNRKVVFALLMVPSIVLISIYWNELLTALIRLFDSIGVDSRTLTMLSDQSFFDDSGRSAIQQTIIGNIGILPKGLYYDRIVANGSYAHNLFLELLLEYGILIGGLIIAWLCYHMVKSAIAVRKDPVASVVLYALIASGFMRLMFSGSYLLNEPGFWLLIGLMLNSCNSRCVKESNRLGELCFKELKEG